MINIFLHGLGQNSSSWERTIEYMNTDIEIKCPNLFDLCSDDLTYINLYEAFSEYCNKFSEPLNICGLSLGGMLAINYAIDNPEKVNSLILIGTQYKIPKLLMSIQNIIFKFIPERNFENMGVSKKNTISLTKSMMDINFKDDLAQIICPTLILCGRKDIYNKKSSRKLEKMIKNAKLKFIEKSSHEVNKDNPKLLAEELSKFLN